uniref:Uncharacterized protein n=1 Tax=Arion vulgaris TaxID=1028688 RepID=A0A0B6ZHY3_9EUPU
MNRSQKLMLRSDERSQLENKRHRSLGSDFCLFWPSHSDGNETPFSRLRSLCYYISFYRVQLV